MAICSLKLGFISRSDGKSSVGFSAYISGSKAVDKRIGQSFNFSHKNEVKTAKILAPEDAPSWALDRRTLWNQVEAFEDHIANLRFQNETSKQKFVNSAQTAQTVMGAIPIEFTFEQAEACVEEFLKSRFVSRGLVVDYAIHDDKGNPHLHALVTRRALEGETFCQRKDREIVSRDQHKITRKTWEQVTNKHLEKAGLGVRIDARSKQDQGSLFLATHHEGWHALRLADQGKYSRIVAENEEIRQRNIEILVEKPEAIIHEVCLKRTTFTQKHIEDELIRRVGGDDELYALLKSKLSDLDINPDLILSTSNDNTVYDANEMRALAKSFAKSVLSRKGITSKAGETMDRETVYTSQSYKQKEKAILANTDVLNEKSRSIDETLVERSIQNRETELKGKLSSEQRTAIRHLCSRSDIRVLNGKAGTGKTTLLKAVAEAYQESGYTVMGTSFQGKAVEIMQKEMGIPCRTLDSFIHHWKKHDGYRARVENGKLWGRPYLHAFQKMKNLESYRFTENHVLIVDEANMIAGDLWRPFLKEASEKGAKVIIVQDPAQIKSREPGDVGRLLSERYGFAETNTVIRQRIEWQASCSQYFNDHQILDGLKPYHDKGHIHWAESKQQAIDKLSKAYVKGYETSSNQMALAFTNDEVRSINQAIRSKFIEQGQLTQHHDLNGEQYSIGDRIRFKENDNHGKYVETIPESFKERFLSDKPKGVKNGSLGFIESIDKTKVTVLLDDNRRVRFDSREYKAFTHGYAMTVHKSEGSTFDRTYVMPSRYMDPESTLVAMTRHRNGMEVFTDRDTFVDLKDMVDTLSRGHLHETLQDYKVSSDQKPYLDRIRLYRDLANEAVSLREEMEGDLDAKTPLYKHGSYKAYQLCYEEKKNLAKLILKDWDNHKSFTRLAGIRKDVLEIEAGLRERLLSDVEQRAKIQVEAYKDIARTTRSLWQHIQTTHPGVLAQDHQLYKDYESRKAERDSLACEFVKSPKLYQQFFREEDGQDKVYWVAVKSHAQAHEVRTSEEVYVKGLSPEQKESYDLLKTYITTRNKSAALYHQIKESSKASVQVQNPEQLLKFKEMQLQRDGHALEVVLNMEDCAPHFDRVNLKEDALLTQAVNAEVRRYAKDYMKQAGPFLTVEYAWILKDALRDKAHYRILKEEGVDMDRLKFDISFGQAIAQGKVSPSQDPDQLYDPIKKYLEANREAGRLWKLVKSGQNDLKPEAKIAFEARNQNTTTLSKSESALGVLSILRPGADSKVMQQAGKRITVNNRYQYKTYQRRHITTDQILQEASRDYRRIVSTILQDEPTSVKSNVLRFGKKGSFAFNIDGPKAGSWYDFSSGEGGNIINLTMRERGCDFKQAIAYLGGELGVTPETKIEPIKRPDPVKFQENEVADKIQKLAAVQSLHSKSVDIKGTIAETYLRRTRHITCDLAEDIRSVPKGTQFLYGDKTITLKHEALATFGRDKDGILLSVQITQLNDRAEKAVDDKGEKLAKYKYGVGKEDFVTLQSDPNSNTVFIAEGVETALSIKQTGIEGTIVAAQGIHNVKNYEGPEKHIVLVADNDDHNPKSGTHKTIAQAKDHFESSGSKVTIIKPDTPGQDFNDVLKNKGVNKIDEKLTPVKVDQVSEKLSSHMEEIKITKDPEKKADLEYDLKLAIKDLKYDPQVLEEVRKFSPMMSKKIEQVMEKGTSRQI